MLNSNIIKKMLCLFTILSGIHLNHATIQYDLDTLFQHDLFEAYPREDFDLNRYCDALDRLTTKYHHRIYSEQISLMRANELLLDYDYPEIFFSDSEIDKIHHFLDQSEESERFTKASIIIDICFRKRQTVLAWTHALTNLYYIFEQRCSEQDHSDEIFRSVSAALYKKTASLDCKLKNEFITLSYLLENTLSLHIVNIDEILDMNEKDVASSDHALFLKPLIEVYDTCSLSEYSEIIFTADSHELEEFDNNFADPVWNGFEEFLENIVDSEANDQSFIQFFSHPS